MNAPADRGKGPLEQCFPTRSQASSSSQPSAPSSSLSPSPTPDDRAFVDAAIDDLAVFVLNYRESLNQIIAKRWTVAEWAKETGADELTTGAAHATVTAIRFLARMRAGTDQKPRMTLEQAKEVVASYDAARYARECPDSLVAAIGRAPVRTGPKYALDPPAAQTNAGLSDAEYRTLVALADGKRTAAIAHERGLGERTVKEYMERTRLKLGAQTNEQAVAIAYQRGLFTRSVKPHAE